MMFLNISSIINGHHYNYGADFFNLDPISLYFKGVRGTGK